MSSHETASTQSRACCDALLGTLGPTNPAVKRVEGGHWCRLDGPSGSMAYILHKKRDGNVTVYLRHRAGDGDRLARVLSDGGVAFTRRPDGAKGWGNTDFHLITEGPAVAETLARALAAYWGLRASAPSALIPEEVPERPGMTEGATTRITVNRYERNPEIGRAHV